jgi:hypothetical protein
LRILWIIAAALGALIGARWLAGPFVLLGIPVNVPLNLEGAFGCLIVLLLVTARPTEPRASASGQTPAILSAAVALAALYPALSVGFLSDDFILVSQAENFTWATLRPLFTQAGGDGFFRPLGYLSFDLNALTGGWHLVSLLLHAGNAAMVAALAGRLGASRGMALLAGSLFALHGTHLEAAVWIAGRFDLLATGFALGALLLFEKRTIAAIVCALAAVWSKEAAYVLPALLTLVARHDRRPLRTTLPYWALTAAAFGYRWMLLGGIGGYEGGQAFFGLKLAPTAKVLFARLWTSLFFPLNWSAEPAWWMALAACAYVGALLWVAWRGRRVPGVWLALGGLVVSILPPLHLLGGAADLSGGRLLYLPSVWFCLLLAFAVAGVERRAAVAVVLVAFHFAAVRHDLPFWQRASQQVRAICEQVPPGEPPRMIDGVPALANGFSQCTGEVNR